MEISIEVKPDEVDAIKKEIEIIGGVLKDERPVELFGTVLLDVDLNVKDVIFRKNASDTGHISGFDNDISDYAYLGMRLLKMDHNSGCYKTT